MENLLNILKGIILGISNVIPGVSAGTMAVVFRIYDKIINSVSYFFKDFKKNFKFLFFIGMGVGLGIILFSNFIESMLNKYPWEMNYLFIGLILGSFGLMFNEVKEHNPEKKHYFYFFVTFLLLVILRFVKAPSSANIIADINFRNFIILLFSGFVASSSMILPGISGSFMLLLFGVYNSIISAVSNFNILVLIPFGIGIILGFFLMTRFISYLLKKHTKSTYMGILGLVSGSVFSIFPGFEFNSRGVFCLVSLIIGFCISYFLCKINRQ